MLNGFTPMATLPTSDLERARAFYEGLGFTAADEETPGGVMFTAGEGGFLVYSSEFAGTNKATAMGFMVPGDAFDDAVAKLREHGVSFDTFEMEGAEWDGDVLVWESMRNVWFRDPDDNIISVGTMG
jgi:catechol 2,3-dioxygenase-like lactoylglutathione lyase family enzyme